MKIGKFFLPALIYVSSATSAFAGLYGDINLGANFISTSKDLTYPLGLTPLEEFKFNSSYNNFHGQLGLGYDFNLQRQWQLAVEGNADLFEGKASQNIYHWFITTSANATERFEYGFGIFIIPKYKLNDRVKLFAGPGFSESHFEVKSNAPTGGNIGYSGRTYQWLSGWGFKAGTSLTLTPVLDLLLTYQFTSYQQMTRTSVEPLSEESLQAKYQPAANLVMLGIRYKFDKE